MEQLFKWAKIDEMANHLKFISHPSKSYSAPEIGNSYFQNSLS